MHSPCIMYQEASVEYAGKINSARKILAIPTKNRSWRSLVLIQSEEQAQYPISNALKCSPIELNAKVQGMLILQLLPCSI